MPKQSKVKLRKACRRHKKFATKDDAWAAARNTNSSKRHQFQKAGISIHPDFVHAWCCKICCGWHIGSIS